MNEAALDGVNCSLGAIASAHFFQHAADMNADRLLSNIELGRYFVVAASAGNQLQDLFFTRRKFRTRYPFRQAVRTARGK